MKNENGLFLSKVGVHSVMLIIVVIGMSAFTFLSFKSCLNERKLSEKSKEAVTVTYGLESEAEESLALIDDIVASEEDGDILSDIKNLDYVTDAYRNAEDEDYYVNLEVKDEGGSGRYLEALVSFNKETGKINILEWKTLHEAVEGSYEFTLPD